MENGDDGIYCNNSVQQGIRNLYYADMSAMERERGGTPFRKSRYVYLHRRRKKTILFQHSQQIKSSFFTPFLKKVISRNFLTSSESLAVQMVVEADTRGLQ